MSKKANIMLVHGAWADGSCWSKVILLLQAKGYNVTAAQIPLTSLENDIDVTRRLLSEQPEPTVSGRAFLWRRSHHRRSHGNPAGQSACVHYGVRSR